MAQAGSSARSIIIGLGHRSGVGKDTAAGALAEAYDARIVSFGDAIYNVVSDLVPFLDAPLREAIEQYGVMHAKRAYRSVVDLLVAVAATMRTRLGPDVWLEPVISRIVLEGGNYIISDVRYLNEALAIRNLGGLLVRIDRPDAPVLHTMADDALEEFTLWDAVVVNDGSIADLRRRVVEATADRVKQKQRPTVVRIDTLPLTQMTDDPGF